MAVPKKKKSLQKIKLRYTVNNSKVFKTRKNNYNLLKLTDLILKNSWMPVNLINKKLN